MNVENACACDPPLVAPPASPRGLPRPLPAPRLLIGVVSDMIGRPHAPFTPKYASQRSSCSSAT